MSMLEARERQSEVIEPMIEPRTGDHDPKRAHVGEVRQAHPPRRVLLAEDHIPAGAVESPPSTNAALQGPARASPRNHHCASSRGASKSRLRWLRAPATTFTE